MHLHPQKFDVALNVCCVHTSVLASGGAAEASGNGCEREVDGVR